MQNKTASEMANLIIDLLIKEFNNKAEDFVIYNVNEDINHKQFNIDFTAYNFYICTIGYERGSFGCGIKSGGVSISLIRGWYEDLDFDIFIKDLKYELELRIPDKYLKAKGWL